MHNSEIYQSNNYGPILILKYQNAKSVLVRFINTGHEMVTRAAHIRSGKVRDHTVATVCGMKNSQVYQSNNYGPIKIIDYQNTKSILIRFVDTCYETTTTAQCVRSGLVRDPLAATVCGVGFLGVGKYKAHINGTPTPTPQYRKWIGMFARCYGKEYRPAYQDVTVCDEWLNFQVFAAWYDKNYPQGVEPGAYQLDKDIKVKGNRTYGPKVCMFVTPQENRAAVNQ